MTDWLPVLLALLAGVVIGITWNISRRGPLGGAAIVSKSTIKRTNGKRGITGGIGNTITDNLGNRYFRGINYLLNEQPDKALEVFLELAEVTPETVETHLSLGNLFRRRGEMDNAIRCHQNIIKQTELSAEERNHALLELGEDYLRAGLLDRAEELFSTLAEQEIATQTALQRLLNIFQQEHEWESAIKVAQQLQRVSGQSCQSMIAHFYCELATEQRQAGNKQAAAQLLKQAEQVDSRCARLWILRAELAMEDQQYPQAADYYRQSSAVDPDCLPLILQELISAYRHAGKLTEAEQFLSDWLRENTDTSAVIAAVELTREQQGVGDANQFLLRELKRQPTVGKMRALLQLSQKDNNQSFPLLDVFSQLSDSLKEYENGYQCRVCGLEGHTHHWHCPSCRSWNSTLPVRGILGQ